MNAFFAFVLSQSILIPIVVGLVYRKNLKPGYFPFFLLLLIGFLNELLSFVLINGFGLRNAISIKVYSLIECCLILYQLYIWRNLKKLYKTYTFIIGVCILTWIIENIFLFKSNLHGPYFMMLYAFFIVLLSINQINIIMVRPQSELLKNPVIVFCISFIIFFTYQIVYQAALYQSQETHEYNGIFTGFAYINFATNILYAIAFFLIKDESNPAYQKHLLNKQTDKLT
ncbi:MAG: hypothetical protein EOP42_13915 [Sphingobacteriaceae bacterium]|nr:MAG: hypothetical protein EOP42_13915 [Sphingobacteriaceae bacterium]